LSALLSAFLSVSKYGAVKLFESPGRAGGLPMKSAEEVILPRKQVNFSCFIITQSLFAGIG
jgi:hypothetical protein